MSLNWNRQQKIEARQHSIIDVYRDIFKQQSIPPNQQYWTLCGKCVVDEQIESGTEPDQLINSEFIKPFQFHGAEIDQDIYNNNLQCKQLNFYHGNIVSVLKDQHYNNKGFNPGIVNADFLRSPKTEAYKFLEILSLLKGYSQVMVAGNFCTKYYGKDDGIDSIIDAMNSYDLSTVVSKYWEVYRNSAFKYVSNKFEMTSVILYIK